MSKRGYRSRYKGRKDQLSSVYGVMYADTDSIKVGTPDNSSSYPSKDEVDRAIESVLLKRAKERGVMEEGLDPAGKVRSLLSIPNPWEGIIDDGIDSPYSISEYPLLDAIDCMIIALMQKNWYRED